MPAAFHAFHGGFRHATCRHVLRAPRYATAGSVARFTLPSPLPFMLT